MCIRDRAKVIEITDIEDSFGNTLSVGMMLIEAYDDQDTAVSIANNGGYNIALTPALGAVIPQATPDNRTNFPMVEKIEKVVAPTTEVVTYDITLGNDGWSNTGGDYNNIQNQNFGTGYKLKFAQRVMNGFSENTDSWRAADSLNAAGERAAGANVNFQRPPYRHNNTTNSQNLGGIPLAVGLSLIHISEPTRPY